MPRKPFRSLKAILSTTSAKTVQAAANANLPRGMLKTSPFLTQIRLLTVTIRLWKAMQRKVKKAVSTITIRVSRFM